MEKYTSWIFAILGMLILVVFVSGCTSSSQNLNKTFSNQGLTFNYPSDWTSGNFIGQDAVILTNLTELGVLDSPTGLELTISQVNLTSIASNTSVESFKNSSKTSLINESAQILSDNQTNVNGAIIYAVVYTKNNTSTNKSEKTMIVITGKDLQNVYIMQFIADPQIFDQNLQIMNKIIASIKIV